MNLFNKFVNFITPHVFRSPTLDEISEQKLNTAREELAAAQHAKIIAEYRIHVATAEINAMLSWKNMHPAEAVTHIERDGDAIELHRLRTG